MMAMFDIFNHMAPFSIYCVISHHTIIYHITLAVAYLVLLVPREDYPLPHP